jgi:uncharacterized alpha-E superfamily protein
MLSRTASDLYWLSRYIERAENTARMLEVSHSMALMPAGRSAREELSAPLHMTGALQDFKAGQHKLNFAELYKFLAWHPSHSTSIYQCLKRARENAHAVRGRITSEMWETINTTWLDLNRMRSAPPDIKPFCDWVKERSHLWRGATYGTIARGDTFLFLRLGTFLERADNTARLLGVKQLEDEDTNALRDYYHWSALLQSLGALEAHQEGFRDYLNASSVAELLILKSDAPRSLRACLEEINSALNQIEGPQGRRAKRTARTLLTQLEFGSIEELQQAGLRNFLDSFLQTIDKIGLEIQKSYLEAV